MSFDLKKDPLVDSFLSTLRLEKGLSENTIKAYSNDCQAFNKWLLIKKRYAVTDSSESDIENYLKYLKSINLSNSSINRKRDKRDFCREKNSWKSKKSNGKNSKRILFE